MTQKTNAALRTEAQIIRDETIAGTNNAERIGTFLDDVLDSLDPMVGHFWQHYRDSAYLVGNKRPIAAGIRTKITNNGVTRTIVSPNGYAAVWDINTNKIVPVDENDFYSIRIDVKAWSDAAATNRFDIEMDIGGAIGVFAAKTLVFSKGAVSAQIFSATFGFFVGSTFIANGGEIYITPESDASFWDMGITLNRTYKEVL